MRARTDAYFTGVAAARVIRVGVGSMLWSDDSSLEDERGAVSILDLFRMPHLQQ